MNNSEGRERAGVPERRITRFAFFYKPIFSYTILTNKKKLFLLDVPYRNCSGGLSSLSLVVLKIVRLVKNPNSIMSIEECLLSVKEIYILRIGSA